MDHGYSDPPSDGTMTAQSPQLADDSGARTRLPRSARREQLLEAAHEVFAASGYHSAAMDEIAVRAGVSKPVLYQHFPSKLELYLALLERHVDGLVAQVEGALNSTTDNRIRVEQVMSAYFDFVDGVGNHSDGAYRLVFESDLRSEPAVSDLVERALSRCVKAIAETIAADTGVDEAEAKLLSVGLVGLAEVSARWWMTSGTTDDPEARPVSKKRAAELLVSLAWRGLSGSPRHP